MHKFNLLTVIAISLAFFGGRIMAEDNKDISYTLVLHGGAGTITPDKLTPELEKAITADLRTALKAGQDILAGGGKAMDAVVTTIMVLENSPHFNAGKGAVFTAEATHEMDSSIMDGSTLDAGAVAGIRTAKNPILAARAVMEKSRHVMLTGAGADKFIETVGIETAPEEYFHTNYRRGQLEKARKVGDTAFLDHDIEYKFGTVGAVALDSHGNLAAGTSTGGMTNKMFGRVGDSPIIGAGTYANNKSCGVSATGHGEFFIRATVARNICALMEYKGLSLQQAADEVVMGQLVEMGGDGGIISVDKDGNFALVFNTKGMYRGSVSHRSAAKIGIYTHTSADGSH